MPAEEIMVPKGKNNPMIALCKFAITYGGCDIIEPATIHKNECVDTIIKICEESNGSYRIGEIRPVAGRGHTLIEILVNDNSNENITFHTYIYIRVWTLWAWMIETDGKPDREFVIDGYGPLIEAVNKSDMLKAYTKDSYDPAEVKLSIAKNECICETLL